MIKIENVITIILCAWLLLCSWQDLRRKRINLILIGIGILTLFICTVIQNELTIWNRLTGLSLGILLLGLNPITKGQIGIGDGLIVSTTGLCLGFSKNAVMLAYGLFTSAIFSIILILFCHVNKKKTIPFIPFLFIGYLGVLLLE